MVSNLLFEMTDESAEKVSWFRSYVSLQGFVISGVFIDGGVL